MTQINWNVLGEDKAAADVVTAAGGGDLVYMSEPHMACCLLVDTSGSMNIDGRINQLNEALSRFAEEVCEDPLSAKRVDVCLISFDSEAKVVVPFCPIKQFNPPKLTAKGGTHMAEGIRYALEAVHNEVRAYHRAGVECYKPFIIMITDGNPTDNVTGIDKLIADREESGKFGHLRFHAFGVQGADMDLLARLTKRVLAIADYDFGQVFNWASRSMQIISHSRVDDKVLGGELGSNMIPYKPGGQLPWDD